MFIKWSTNRRSKLPHTYLTTTMSDTSYPLFEQYKPATSAYLKFLLKPYHDALSVADSISALNEWIPLVLPESSEALIEAIADLDVEQAKLVILETFASTLVTPYDTSSTPWDLNNRSKLAERLFGPSSDTVPVLVQTENNQFLHELTLDQTYGILIGLNDSPSFQLYISDVPITSDDYLEIFNSSIAPSYVATINGEEYFFGDNQFVQGVITAAEWLDIDPHTIITDLIDADEYGNKTPLTF